MNEIWTKRAAQAIWGSVLLAGLALSPSTAVMAQSSAAAVRGLPDFTDLVEQVGPSVVNIRTLEKVRPSAPGAAGCQGSPPGRGTAASRGTPAIR